MGDEFKLSDYVYEKKFTCPVCETEFMCTIAKFGKSRMVSTDTDLKQNYTPFDPTPYDIIVCSACGYAETPTAFPTPLPEKTAERLLAEIKPKYWGHVYPADIGKDMALERFEIAIECNKVKRGKIGARAYLYLKMAWICREAEDAAGEEQYLKKALSEFKLAFQAEKPPIAGMDEFAVSYLIGELERRLGNEDEALRWFGKVVSSRGAQQRIKDRAINQKDLIMEQRKAAQAPEPAAAEAAEQAAAKAPAKAPKADGKKKKFLWF